MNIESLPDDPLGFFWKHHQSILLAVIAGCLVWIGTAMKDATSDARSIRQAAAEARHQCSPISSFASGELTVKLDTVADEFKANEAPAWRD